MHLFIAGNISKHDSDRCVVDRCICVKDLMLVELRVRRGRHVPLFPAIDDRSNPAHSLDRAAIVYLFILLILVWPHTMLELEL